MPARLAAADNWLMPERSKPRSVLSNAAWNAFGTLFNIVITFLLAPLLIHRLGVDQWGLLLLVWSLSGVLGVANFGLGEATLRFVSHHHGQDNLAGVNRVVGATLTYYVSICALITAALWFGAPLVAQWVKVPEGSNYPLTWLIRLTALLFSVGMIANAFRAIPMALHRYDVTNKVGSIHGATRSIGLVLLVLAHLDVLYLVVWEVLLACVVLLVHVVIARRMMPGIRCLPSMSLAGIREIIGYSMFSFATHVFLMAWREGPKLMLGNRLGTASVAHLGTPDSVSNRLHMIVVSAIETLVPRFSGPQGREAGKSLLTVATWAAFACGAVLYVPLAVLMPDFLRLWISPEFAGQAGRVGQILTLSLIGPAGYAAIATLFRGIGKPEFVTGVMAAVAIVVLVASVLMAPALGVLGVAWAYLLGTLAWLAGLFFGWLWLYGRGSLGTLARIAGLPLVLGGGLVFAQSALRDWWGEPGWIGLIVMGGAFAAIGAVVLVTVDRSLGGASPAGLVIARILGSGRVVALRKRMGWALERTP
jgi:O-antigen/teichoic acid export membrane protein